MTSITAQVVKMTGKYAFDKIFSTETKKTETVMGDQEAYNEDETRRAIWMQIEDLCQVVMGDTSLIQAERALVLTSAKLEMLSELSERMKTRKPHFTEPALKADLNSLYRALLRSYDSARQLADNRKQEENKRRREMLFAAVIAVVGSVIVYKCL